MIAGSIYEVSLNSKHLELAVEDYVPIGLHGINLKPPAESRVAWSDVGGLTEAKRIIIETLKWPTQVYCTFFFYKLRFEIDL